MSTEIHFPMWLKKPKKETDNLKTHKIEMIINYNIVINSQGRNSENHKISEEFSHASLPMKDPVS